MKTAVGGRGGGAAVEEREEDIGRDGGVGNLGIFWPLGYFGERERTGKRNPKG